MKRYDRSHFFAFGVLQAVNVLGLLLYGLDIATRGLAGGKAPLPALIGLAGFCLLMAMAAAVKRGRDLGWAAWMTVVAFWVSFGLGPVLLGLIGYLAFAKSKPAGDEFGPPAEPANVGTWVWALANLAWPWVVLAILAKLF